MCTLQEQRLQMLRSLQPLTLLLPHLFFKTGLPKPFGELRVLWGMNPPIFLAWLCNESFSAPNPNVLLCLASLCIRQMNLHFVTLLTKVPLHSPAISTLPLVIASMSHFLSVLLMPLLCFWALCRADEPIL